MKKVLGQDSIYTVEGLQLVLKVKPKTIRNLAASGELKAYKKLGRWYFLHSDVLAYLQS